MSEQEFEQYVRSIGYCNVSMDEKVEISHGADIVLEFLQDQNITGTVRLRDVYNQVKKIQGVIE